MVKKKLLIAFIILALAIIIFGSLFYSSFSLETKASLRVFFVGAIFSVLILAFILNLKIIIKQLKENKRKTLGILVLIFITALFLRINIPTYIHQQYTDELYYLHEAQAISNEGKDWMCYAPSSFLTGRYETNCENYLPSEKLVGTALIYSIIFKFGFNEYHIAFLNILISSLSLFLLFLISKIIFNNEKIGLISAFLYTFLPISIHVASTTGSDNLSTFFILLTMYFFLLLPKINSFKLKFLFLTTLLFTLYIRQENFILIIFFLLISNLLKYKTKIILDKKMIITILAFLIGIIPYLDSIGLATGGVDNPVLALFEYGTLNWIFLWFGFSAHSVFYTIFLIFGIYYLYKNNKNYLKFFILLFLMFAVPLGLYWGIYTPHIFRYMLTPYIPFIIISSYGINELLKNKLIKSREIKLSIIAILVILSLLFYIPTINFNEDSLQKRKPQIDFVLNLQNNNDLKDCKFSKAIFSKNSKILKEEENAPCLIYIELLDPSDKSVPKWVNETYPRYRKEFFEMKKFYNKNQEKYINKGYEFNIVERRELEKGHTLTAYKLINLFDPKNSND